MEVINKNYSVIVKKIIETNFKLCSEHTELLYFFGKICICIIFLPFLRILDVPVFPFISSDFIFKIINIIALLFVSSYILIFLY